MTIASTRPKNYLSNAYLLEELRLSREQDRMTNNLAKACMLLVERYGRKPNFSGYSYIDEMKGEAIVLLCSAWKKFDPTKSNNPFSYFTTTCQNAFVGVLNRERMSRDIRDGLLLEAGHNVMGYGHKQGDSDAAHWD